MSPYEYVISCVTQTGSGVLWKVLRISPGNFAKDLSLEGIGMPSEEDVPVQVGVWNCTVKTAPKTLLV